MVDWYDISLQEVDIILAYLDEMCCNRMAGIRLAVSLNGNGLSFVGVKIHGKDSSYIIRKLK